MSRNRTIGCWHHNETNCCNGSGIYKLCPGAITMGCTEPLVDDYGMVMWSPRLMVWFRVIHSGLFTWSGFRDSDWEQLSKVEVPRLESTEQVCCCCCCCCCCDDDGSISLVLLVIGIIDWDATAEVCPPRLRPPGPFCCPVFAFPRPILPPHHCRAGCTRPPPLVVIVILLPFRHN